MCGIIGIIQSKVVLYHGYRHRGAVGLVPLNPRPQKKLIMNSGSDDFCCLFFISDPCIAEEKHEILQEFKYPGSSCCADLSVGRHLKCSGPSTSDII